MKKSLLVLLMMTVTVWVNAQFNADKTPLITQSLSKDNITEVQVETSGGSITVTGVEAGQEKIEVYVVPNNYSKNRLSEEEIRQRMQEDYKLTLTTENNKLVAIARPLKKNMNWKKGLSFSFKVFVPSKVSSDLVTSGGSISLSNLSGSQEFATSGGSLHVEKLSGKIRGTTSGGSIDARELKDDITLTTSGGSIKVNDCKGTLALSTSGGSIQLANLKGKIRAATSGGSINGNTIGGELSAFTSGGSVILDNLTCSVEAGTSGGHIKVVVKELGEYVRLTNSGGSIELRLPNGKGMDLELTGHSVRVDKLENFSGKLDKDRVEGKLNGGGTKVSAKTSAGSVTLELQ